jgi:hypothetical protein
VSVRFGKASTRMELCFLPLCSSCGDFLMECIGMVVRADVSGGLAAAAGFENKHDPKQHSAATATAFLAY